MKKVYIASPFGFSETCRNFYYKNLLPLISEAGFQFIDPWVLTDKLEIEKTESMEYGKDKRKAWQKLNIKIAGNNRRAIDSCDIMLAVLDGTDVDSGTASEIGYAFARGKKILGYRGDIRLTGDNEGATVNLQVEYFITQSGGEIINNYNDIPKYLSKISQF